MNSWPTPFIGGVWYCIFIWHMLDYQAAKYRYCLWGTLPIYRFNVVVQDAASGLLGFDS